MQKCMSVRHNKTVPILRWHLREFTTFLSSLLFCASKTLFNWVHCKFKLFFDTIICYVAKAVNQWNVAELAPTQSDRFGTWFSTFFSPTFSLMFKMKVNICLECSFSNSCSRLLIFSRFSNATPCGLIPKKLSLLSPINGLSKRNECVKWIVNFMSWSDLFMKFVSENTTNVKCHWSWLIDLWRRQKVHWKSAANVFRSVVKRIKNKFSSFFMQFYCSQQETNFTFVESRNFSIWRKQAASTFKST